MTKSHIPAINAPVRIDVIPEEITIQRKRGRPIGSKDKNPRKRKEQNKEVDVIPEEIIKTPEEVDSRIPEETINKTLEEVDDRIPEEINNVPEETEVLNESEISINYVQNCTIWNRTKTRVDESFAYAIAIDVLNEWKPRPSPKIC